jgi:hypothetical protein
LLDRIDRNPTGRIPIDVASAHQQQPHRQSDDPDHGHRSSDYDNPPNQEIARQEAVKPRLGEDGEIWLVGLV